MAFCYSCLANIQATNAAADGKVRPDEDLSAAIYRVVAATGKTFDEASVIVARAEPELVKRWKESAQRITFGA